MAPAWIENAGCEWPATHLMAEPYLARLEDLVDKLELGEAGRWRRAGDGGEEPFEAAIRSYLSSEVDVVPALPMSDEDVARLRALGYLPPEEGAAQALDTM